MTAPQKPLRLTNAQHKALRHLPQVVERMTRAAHRALGQLGVADLYEVIVQNDPSTKRARVFIAPKGVEGMIDDAENSTILKLQSAMRGM